jgi:hypothetical protein
MMNNLYFEDCMKRLILLLLIAYSTSSEAQKRMPDYDTVIAQFFSRYSHENTVKEILNFAKKKDGWYVEILNPSQDGKVESSQVFWSLQKGRYQVLENFLRATKDKPLEEKVNEQKYSAWYSAYGYSRCVYYGYEGWDIDVINDFGNASIDNDTLYESLARAYSQHMTRYTWYQYGGKQIGDDTLQRKLDRLQMPGDERVKKIIECTEKAIACYQKIFGRNKNYRGFAGTIESMVFDETVHGWLQLSMCNRPTEAERFLKMARMPQEDSLMATNMLNAIEPNAILITFGDNDIYPIYYLQEKHKIGTGVSVLHATLLSFPPYLDMMKRKNYVQFSTTAEGYGNPDYDYAFYSGRPSGKKLQIADFVARRRNLSKVPATRGDSVQVYHEKELYMPFGNTDTLRIRLPEQVYLNDFILLDIIAHNLNERPIYFTAAWPAVAGENMHQRGNLYRLSPAK